MSKIQSLLDLQRLFPTEQSCIEFFERIIWSNNPTSPFDSNSKVYKCANNEYKCKNTSKRFNIKIGTIFENTKLPLLKWIYSFYLFANHKKGISSIQLSKHLKVNQRTAWFISHRIRNCLKNPLFELMLEGFVEVDETYLGGANPNRHWNKKVPRCQGRNWKDKTPVLVLIQRKGKAIAQVVPNVEMKTLEPIIRSKVKAKSNVYTDEWLAYNNLKKWYNHSIVNHRRKQYVNGNASTNVAENFNAHLKRGIYGTYHWISKKHTQKYVDEFTFRMNTRKNTEEERLNFLVSSSIGQRLTYQQLIT